MGEAALGFTAAGFRSPSVEWARRGQCRYTETACRLLRAVLTLPLLRWLGGYHLVIDLRNDRSNFYLFVADVPSGDAHPARACFRPCGL
jgi:hypothetical protein